jgi:hypothetical protein
LTKLSQTLAYPPYQQLITTISENPQKEVDINTDSLLEFYKSKSKQKRQISFVMIAMLLASSKEFKTIIKGRDEFVSLNYGNVGFGLQRDLTSLGKEDLEKEFKGFIRDFKDFETKGNKTEEGLMNSEISVYVTPRKKFLKGLRKRKMVNLSWGRKYGHSILLKLEDFELNLGLRPMLLKELPDPRKFVIVVDYGNKPEKKFLVKKKSEGQKNGQASKTFLLPHYYCSELLEEAQNIFKKELEQSEKVIQNKEKIFRKKFYLKN